VLRVTTDPHFIAVDGRPIATRRREGSGPATLLFLSGYASDMDGTKALALDAWTAERGIGLVRFDYSGTGSSPGPFVKGTLERWLDEALAVADQLTEGPLIPVGSSMGAWIALHLALRRPARVRGLLGIAAAPDFTDWGYDGEDRRVLQAEGRLERPNPYGGEAGLTTLGFWQSGERLKLLGGEIAIDCPVRLVHGDRDEEVPLDVAVRLKDRLRSADVQLWLVKGGGHRLSAPHEIRTILRAAADLLEHAE
jgi:pimeloyl-ACP methyl ester carboxylesterase